MPKKWNSLFIYQFLRCATERILQIDTKLSREDNGDELIVLVLVGTLFVPMRTMAMSSALGILVWGERSRA